ncbi:MAG: Pr6Pr family membrane protein [Cytophagales bacterium]|nr:Pr6Pr family membrane protein [Rhizobacter sp.]
MLMATRILLATLVLVAIGQQLALHLGASYSALNFFSYFTNLSNLFAAAVLLLTARSSSFKNAAFRDAARFASVTNMTVVGLVFAVLLRDVDLGALLPWVNFVLHYVMPLAILIDWLWKPPASMLSARHFIFALVFPVVYLAYVVVRGASVGWYPYPFLNPANVGGYGGVAVYAFGIAATFFLAGWALLAVGNRRSAASEASQGATGA